MVVVGKFAIVLYFDGGVLCSALLQSRLWDG